MCSDVIIIILGSFLHVALGTSAAVIPTDQATSNKPSNGFFCIKAVTHPGVLLHVKSSEPSMYSCPAVNNCPSAMPVSLFCSAQQENATTILQSVHRILVTTRYIKASVCAHSFQDDGHVHWKYSRPLGTMFNGCSQDGLFHTIVFFTNLGQH